jgi:hypothetical protein
VCAINSMAFYSPSEIQDILVKLSQEPQIELKYKKFQRLGILVKKDKEKEKLPEFNEIDDVQQYSCSVCRKKLISAHLLDLHVSENHDSFFDTLKLRKPMVSRLKFVITLSSLLCIHSTHATWKNVKQCALTPKTVKITA